MLYAGNVIGNLVLYLYCLLGGLSDRGYSSMTSEDAKRMSLTIGSQESLESLGGLGKVRPMFINRETIKENGPAESTEQPPPVSANNNNTGKSELARNKCKHISCVRSVQMELHWHEFHPVTSGYLKRSFWE